MSELSPQDRRLIAIIEEAARSGEPCPTNSALAEALNMGQSRASELIQRLEAAGVLAVERFSCARRVTVLDSGLATAQPENTTPWKQRDTTKRPRPKARRGAHNDPYLPKDFKREARGIPCSGCGCKAECCSCRRPSFFAVPVSAASIRVGG